MSSKPTSDAFHGVYLLRSSNELFKGRVYIGYTVNPERRLSQHNKGRQCGGARRTHLRGPWEMILIVHGFPTRKRALQFEWAWQHPALSTRLKSLERKSRKESTFQYHLRLMESLLCASPWGRLPLTIHVFNQAFASSGLTKIPPHVSLTRGEIAKEPFEFTFPEEDLSEYNCHLCSLKVKDSNFVMCYLAPCSFFSHMVCLAKEFLKNSSHVLPVSGDCPKCSKTLIWGILVRNSKRLNPG